MISTGIEITPIHAKLVRVHIFLKEISSSRHLEIRHRTLSTCLFFIGTRYLVVMLQKLIVVTRNMHNIILSIIAFDLSLIIFNVHDCARDII